MSKPVKITLTLELFEDEHVRVALGPGFIRLTHGSRATDVSKSQALDNAVEAGVMTSTEAEHKRREHYLLASESHILDTAKSERSAMGISWLAQDALKHLAAKVRARTSHVLIEADRDGA